MHKGGQVPVRNTDGYRQPTGPKNMGSGVGSMADIYRHGSQGPTPCENYESGKPGLGGDNCGTDGTQKG